MLLSRTRKEWAFQLRDGIFRAGGFQRMLDERHRRECAHAMGFLPQWEEHRRFQFDFLRSRGLQPHHRFLEIGCGPLTGGVPIIGYLDPGNYTGIDVRASVLELAYLELVGAKLTGKSTRLLRSDSFGEDYLTTERFDFILSFSVLYHMSDDVLNACLAAIRSRLSPDGTYFANVNVDLDDSTWLQFPFLRRSVETYGEAARRHGLQMEQLGTLGSLGLRLADAAERTNPLLAFRLA